MNKLGLYLHVPFCRRKCAYCDFCSGEDLSLVSAYEKALCRQLSSLRPRLRDYEVDTVYFGGGTPSLLSPAGIGRIFSALRESACLSSDCEISFEANPDSLTDRVLAAFREAGANRISLGMQSAHDEELALLGRLHRAEQTDRAVALSRREGFDNLSLDLMYGLPGQDKASFAASLRHGVELGADHLSFYLLTLSEDVPLYQKRALLPDDETVREMYLFASNYVKQEGFDHYEISNAARHGRISCHNERYWRRSPYLGLGPGAHSFFENERFSQPCDTARFLSTEDPFLLREDVQILSENDVWEETLMLSLRLSAGVDLSLLARIGGEERATGVAEKLRSFESLGLCRPTPLGYALTAEGFFVSNTILSELI